jgi:hypothetical protein
MDPKCDFESKRRDLCSFLAHDLETQEAVGHYHCLAGSGNAGDPTGIELHRKYLYESSVFNYTHFLHSARQGRDYETQRKISDDAGMASRAKDHVTHGFSNCFNFP